VLDAQVSLLVLEVQAVAVPVHAVVQVQLFAEQVVVLVLPLHGIGVPVQLDTPSQVHPYWARQVAAERPTHAEGVPEHEAVPFHAHPVCAVHVVELVSVAQVYAVPLQFGATVWLHVQPG
jgi:hypothetical protein